MSNLVRTQIHISSIQVGMTIESNGELITVTKNSIKHDGFIGYSFLGDASKKMLTRVQFAVPTANGIVLR